MSIASDAQHDVVYATPVEAADMFDRIARANMSISGAEFLQRWDRGDYDGVDWDDIPGLAEVAAAVPFAR